MQEPFDISTIIFALLAAFVVWKLRSVLGTRTGHERPPQERKSHPERNDESRSEGKVIRLPGAANDAGAGDMARNSADRWAPFAAPDTPLAKGFDQIAALDSGFRPRDFVDGAKSAYEMIIGAFAAGDRQTLRGLLAKDVYESFAAAVSDRESRGDSVETTFVSIDKADFVDVQVRGKTANITIKFQSKLITATRDRSGAVIDGNPDKVVDMVDIWTFAREVTSRDPNWRLVATEAGA
ncbi:MAG: Tim44/TimA family putative adaptor protein [Beijerinckiaceae bacterium]